MKLLKELKQLADQEAEFDAYEIREFGACWQEGFKAGQKRLAENILKKLGYPDEKRTD